MYRYLDVLLAAKYELLCCIVAMYFLYIFFIQRRNAKIIPCPVGLPIVGYLPFMTKFPPEKLFHLSKKYGNVFRLKLGLANVVILNGFEAIKEGMTKTEFLGRPSNSVIKMFLEESPFFTASVKSWQEHRKFMTHAIMRESGVNKSKIEDFINEEIGYFLKAVEERNGQAFDLSYLLISTIVNNISALIFGKRFEYGSEEINIISDTIEKTPKLLGNVSLNLCFPFIKYVPFVTKLLDYESSIKALGKLKDFVKKQKELHKTTLNSEEPRDLIDHYLLEIKSKREKNIPTMFSEEILLMSMMDIIGAGSETVKNSLQWCFYILAAFPEAQQRILNEIEDVIGQRQPSSEDLKLMPFTHSFMLEAWRWKTIIPFGIARHADEAATVDGHLIPRGSIIIANFWSVHHDPELWEDHEKFRPERFLSKDQKSVLKPKHLLTFSIGKRTCIGEAMATMEVFFYLVNTLQKFSIKMPEGVVPTYDAYLGLAFCLKPHKLCLIPRRTMN